ncbi:MAG: glycosyltransferase family 4 protein, partial [Pseudomonadota bacterium]
LGAPVAVRLHGPHFLGKVDEMGPEDHIRIKAEGVAIREAEAITSPSPGLLEETKTYYGGAGAAHRAIPNPVEFPSDTDLWRFEACDPHLVLFVGRFDLRKGADVTLAAFAMVAEKNPRARLVMAGPDRGIVGDDGALIHFPEYAQANLSEDVRDRVEFLGSVPYESLLELRRRACVYVSTSRFECCAYAAMEALAAACPVILSETFGPPELLNLGKDILTAPIGDAAGIAKHIESVLGDPERAQALSAAGRAAAERHFAPEIVAGQLAAFYKEVLAARS